MRILVTGKTGQVGWRLARLLPQIGETLAVGRETMDLARPDTIRETLRGVRPDIVVNAAGITHVDRAESESALVHAVNAVAPGIMAEEAQRLGALFVHYSSVFVFDGRKPTPYVETDEPHPVNVYGHAKLQGDYAVAQAAGDHLILRVSWVYDVRGRNFLLTMLRLAELHPELDVVDDQVGSPSWAQSIAAATVDILRNVERARSVSGLYNLSALGAVSRYDWTRRILDLTRDAREAPRLVAIKTRDFPLPAERPLNAVLDSALAMKTFGIELDHWDDALRACVAELGAAGAHA